MTREDFASLLTLLGATTPEAATHYEQIRARLIRLFAWERCPFPEDHADEVFNRLARRAHEGQPIPQPEHYCFGIARFVIREVGADLRRRAAALEEMKRATPPAPAEDPAAAKCLETCLGQLSAEERKLAVRYYRGEGRERIENRKNMAIELAVPLNTLRNRALRLRERLEACLRRCSGLRDTSSISGITR